MSTHRHDSQVTDTPPTVRETADLTARLPGLTAVGLAINSDERAGFLADKAALLARIPATMQDPR